MYINNIYISKASLHFRFITTYLELSAYMYVNIWFTYTLQHLNIPYAEPF